MAVTLTGTNFVSPATVSTTNSGIAVSGVTVVSSTRITATFSIGASAALGAANVTVTSSGGTSGAVAFTVYQAPLTSVSTFPVGLQVSVDGVSVTCNPYCNYYWAPGTSHTIAASTQPGTTGTQWLWASWSDGGAASHGITASTSGASYTASFNPQYYFTSSVSPPGTGTIAPGSGWYNAGASFWATATPSTGYQLSSFNPGGAVPSYDVVMNGPVTLTANFVAFTGQTIASNPPGAALTVDGHSCTAPCTFYWTNGTQHTIATTSPQSLGSGSQLVFASWSDGSTGSSDTITAAAGTTYTANFNAQYYLTTAASPSGDGTVSPPSGWYNAGAQVTLGASASSGYQFTNFTGTANGGLPLTVTMNAPASETANFAVNGGFTITATPSDQTVAAGGGAAYIITPTATSGFSGQIALSGSCDSDVVPVFSPATIPATGSSTATLTSSSSDSFDLTNCTITGTSGANIGRVPIILRLYVSVRIAIAPTGVGLSATTDGGPPNGITQVAPIQVLWKVGSTHTVSVASPQAGTDGNEYAFVSWSDGGAVSHTVTVSHAVRLFTATLALGCTISGQVTAGLVGLPGVTVGLSGSSSSSTVTDANGDYSLSATVGGSYTVTPQQGGAYTFSPPQGTFGSLACPATANFSVATFTELGSPGPEPPASTPTAPTSSSTSNSGQDCSDLTGSWNDPNLGAPGTGGATWTISSMNGAFSGSLSGYDTGDGTCAPVMITWAQLTVSESAGTFSLTASNPSPATFACNGNEFEEPTTYSVSVSGTSCSVATPANYSVTWPSTGTSGAVQSRIAQVPPALKQWTRSSVPPGVQLTVTLYDTTPNSTDDGSVSVVLSGTNNKAADLTVAIKGPAQTQLTHQSELGPGTYGNISLQRATLPAGQYGTVTATWGSFSLPVNVAFNVLGTTRFSQYNTTAEVSCTQPAVPVYVFINNTQGGCYGFFGTVKSDFLAYTVLNGSGLSADYGLVKPWAATWLKSNTPKVPDPCPVPPLPGLSANNTLVAVTQNTGQCYTMNMVAGTSLATYLGPLDSGSPWNCGDNVLLVDPNTGKANSVRVVQDRCPACVDGAHIDAYSANTSCDPHQNIDLTPPSGGKFTAIRSNR